ncbi:hypothetical protein M0R45_018209 [Rubus argutus]|uniref:RING-type domain-containing protein n=1 Tax=Rubus argutus TaxID=59490 RepID=A0AAW1X1S7_RUBAR
MLEAINADLQDLDDEAAHNARKRLEKRLGHFRPSSSNQEGHHGSSSSLSAEMNHQHDKVACAICLENFEAEEEAMELTCAHKFFPLSSVLASSPSGCPYCRTNVFVCS